MGRRVEPVRGVMLRAGEVLHEGHQGWIVVRLRVDALPARLPNEALGGALALEARCEPQAHADDFQRAEQGDVPIERTRRCIVADIR